MQISLYIAQSLDGYIADEQHGLDWLESVADGDEDYGYGEFYQAIDALAMGYGTYEVIKDFTPWPYEDKPAYVVSHRSEADDGRCRFVGGTPQHLRQLWSEAGHQHLWLVGGGQLVAAFLDANLIDDIILSILPVSLGRGIPLFPPRGTQQRNYDLVGHRAYATGLVQLHYRSREASLKGSVE